MKRIDINCDMGESFGRYRLGVDEEIMGLVSSANIACGWHAGDPIIMDRTVKMAAHHGAAVGAHPSYPDAMGFGRRAMDCTEEEIKKYVTYQIGALSAFCKVHNIEMSHVKPHGSLYNSAVEKPEVARAIASAMADLDPNLIYVALAGSKGKMMARMGMEAGLKIAYEAFPDRAYSPDGNLLSRRQPGAVIESPAEVAERGVLIAKEHKLCAVDGTVIDMEAQTLCIHGETPHALEMARTLRSFLQKEGVAIKPLHKWL